MSQITVRKISKDNCRPCTVLANYLSEIDFESHNAELVEMNVTEDPSLAERYNLMNVPVLILERNNVEISRVSGLVPVEQIEEMIQEAKEAK